MTILGCHWELERDKVWQDRGERRKKRTCARCGFYFKYWITEGVRPVTIPDYKGDQKFYEMSYEIHSEKVVNEGNVTDDFYELCDRCMDHVRGVQAYDIPFNKSEIERELSRLKQAEARRRWIQEEEVAKARAEVNKARKEAAEGGEGGSGPINALEKLGRLIKRGGSRSRRKQEEGVKGI